MHGVVRRGTIEFIDVVFYEVIEARHVLMVLVGVSVENLTHERLREGNTVREFCPLCLLGGGVGIGWLDIAAKVGFVLPRATDNTGNLARDL
jgi:hypothetical protein